LGVVFVWGGAAGAPPGDPPHPITKPEDYAVTAVRDYLFNIFTATLHNWRPSPPSGNLRTCNAMVMGSTYHG
jgi:hypothetical protein